jgi:hypothetical protein
MDGRRVSSLKKPDTVPLSNIVPLNSQEAAMKRSLTGLAIGLALASTAMAQSADPDPAINNPDKVSWELFTLVTPFVPGLNNTVVFETWASNEDTFQLKKFPGTTADPSCTPPVVVAGAPVQPQAVVTPTASPKILNVSALAASAPRVPGLQPHVLRGGSQETRRNKATFDFIFCNKLNTRAGLRAAFAASQPISFPIDSIEVKADWVPAGNLSPSDFHINTASDNKRYALVSLHIISKQVPNWTWATFEHKDNPGRCDFIGCHDHFGAVVQDVQPNNSPDGTYNPCTKAAAVKKLFTDAGLPALWENYCLKGSQVDFVTATGVPTQLGNTVPEGGFVKTSSCMTCHSRAAVDSRGRPTTSAGFLDPPIPALCPDGPLAACSPNGAPNPAWFWNNLGQPNQSMLALQTDFIWSIPREATGP